MLVDARGCLPLANAAMALQVIIASAVQRWKCVESLEGLAEALAAGDLAEGLAIFALSGDWLGRIAKGKNRQHGEVVGNAQRRFHRLDVEADPVRADPFGPRRQQHGLD